MSKALKKRRFVRGGPRRLLLQKDEACPLLFRHAGRKSIVTCRLVLCCCVIIALGTDLRAENWPQWRGPRNDGVSNEKNLAAQWSDTQNVIWKLHLPGMSGATPAIWGDRIFLTSEAGG